MPSLRYIVICPVRNEGRFLAATLGCLERQTILPVRLVIVDDGSQDDTSEIAQRAAARNPWIEVVTRKDRGFRQAGQGVIEAFYDGYRTIEKEPFDFIVKLDGDVTFPEDYFEGCFRLFAQWPELGIGGGTVCREGTEGWVPESIEDPGFHVRGATKIYRAACWHDLGGLLNEPGWDTLDEVKANMLGWTTGTFAEIRLLHHRPAGGAYGTWNNWVKNGRANFVAGYHPLFMAAKCVKRLGSRPYVTAAVGLGYGFLRGYLGGARKVEDPELVRYFRDQQMRRLRLRPCLWDQKPLR